VARWAALAGVLLLHAFGALTWVTALGFGADIGTDRQLYAALASGADVAGRSIRHLCPLAQTDRDDPDSVPVVDAVVRPDGRSRLRLGVGAGRRHAGPTGL
jgi:hypothetical protein